MGLVCTCLSSLSLQVAGLVCSFGSPGPSSVPQGLCALDRFVWPATLSTVLCCALQGFYGLLLVLSPPLLWAVHGLRNSAFSVFWLLSPCLDQFSKIMKLPLGFTCEGASQCTGNPPVSGLPLFIRAQASIQKFSVFSLFMSPSSVLHHFRELILSPWRSGVFRCHLEVAL